MIFYNNTTISKHRQRAFLSQVKVTKWMRAALSATNEWPDPLHLENVLNFGPRVVCPCHTKTNVVQKHEWWRSVSRKLYELDVWWAKILPRCSAALENLAHFFFFISPLFQIATHMHSGKLNRDRYFISRCFKLVWINDI